jgi:cytidylate kinase
MTGWQPGATSSTEGLGTVATWPRAFSRWLFGSGPEVGRERVAEPRVARFQNICISREAGAGAGAIARLIGQKLGWKVYDQEFVEAIAHRMEVSVDEVRVLDELAPSVVQDWLLPLREEYYAPQEAYLDHLAKLVEAIGRAGESILVGRGAGFLLPRETTLSVRIVAPMRVRALRLSERMGVSVRTARRAARDLDRRRNHFERTMYRVNSLDPHNYDLLMDSESVGLEIAAELIAHAVRVGRMGVLSPTASAARLRTDTPPSSGERAVVADDVSKAEVGRNQAIASAG